MIKYKNYNQTETDNLDIVNLFLNEEYNFKYSQHIFTSDFDVKTNNIIIKYLLNPNYTLIINPELLYYGEYFVLPDLLSKFIDSIKQGIEKQKELFGKI